MRLVVQRSIIFRINPAIGIIILSDQTAIRHHFHPVHPFFFIVYQVCHIVSIRSWKRILHLCPVPYPGKVFASERFFQIFQRKRHRRYPAVRKKRIKPYHFRVLKSNVLCHVLNVVLRKHICKNKLCFLADPPQKLCPVCLRILHPAAGPANSQVKIIYHGRFPSSSKNPAIFPASFSAVRPITPVLWPDSPSALLW